MMGDNQPRSEAPRAQMPPPKVGVATRKMQAMRDAEQEYELKRYIRAGGYSAQWKKEAWLFGAGINRTEQEINRMYDLAREDTFGDMFGSGHDVVGGLEDAPRFGGDMEQACRLLEAGCALYRHESVEVRHDRLITLLWLVQHEFPDIEYCPQLPCFAAVLLSHLSAAETYVVVRTILKDDHKLKLRWHFTLTKYRWRTNLYTMVDIVKERLPDIGAHMDNLNITAMHIEPIVASFFSSALPFQGLLLLTAPFIHEGSKVILRYLIAFLQLSRDRILQCGSADDFVVMLHDALLDPLPVDVVASDAFAIRQLRKNDIERRHTRVDSGGVIRRNLSVSDLDKAFLLPKRLGHVRSDVFSDAQRDGHNLERMYTLCGDSEDTILAIQDTKGRVFGGFATASWNGRARVSGDADCFLFSFANGKAQHYVATGINSLFQITTRRSLQMGGGGDGAGLYVNRELQQGNSYWSETFNNDPLADDKEPFDIRVLEVWVCSEE